MNKIGVKCLRFVSKRKTVRVPPLSCVAGVTYLTPLAAIATSSGVKLLPSGVTLVAILRR